METKSQIENLLFEFIKENTLNGTKEIKSDTLIFKEGIFDMLLITPSFFKLLLTDFING